LIPFVCVLLGLDPSVIAGPAMTSIVDVTGLMSYFLIANQIFKLYGLEL
jgi:Mg/Co/Ni transporter MgtE